MVDEGLKKLGWGRGEPNPTLDSHGPGWQSPHAATGASGVQLRANALKRRREIPIQLMIVSIFPIRFLAGAILFGALTSSNGQTFFTAPNGGGTGLVRVENGSGQFVRTGLGFHDFPRISPDGSFITFASQDPTTPNEVSTDLYRLDRRNGQLTKLLNFSTVTAPNGANAFVNPLFSSYSYSNARFVLAFRETETSNNNPSRNVTVLAVYPEGAPQNFAIAEIGQRIDVQSDITDSEFRGVSWFPNSATFAAPAYVPVIAQNSGRSTVSTGIVLFSQTSATPFRYGRVGQLTTPRVEDVGGTIIQSTHIYPAISPDGEQVAFFDVTFPDPFLRNAVTTRLVIGNSNGTSFRVRQTFAQGQYPAGLSWTADGNSLIFGMGPQRFNGVIHASSPEPASTVIRQIAADGTSLPTTIPGAGVGLYPSVALLSPPAVDLSTIQLSLTPNGEDNGLTLRAPGLPAGESFNLESTTDLANPFGDPQTFTGSEFSSGININNEGSRFFRITRP